MHRRGLRHGLVVVLFLAAAGAAAFAWSIDQQLAAVATAEHAVASRFDKLVQSIARFDSAQQTFDASRESEADWFSRVQRQLADIATESEGLRASPASAAAARTFADVTSRVESAVARAEENLRAGHDLMAADLVQDEGKPGAEAMRAAVLEWRTAESGAADSMRATLLQQLWVVLGGTAGLWALGVLLLAPRPSDKTAATATPATSVLLEPADRPALSLAPPAPEPSPVPPPATVAAVDLQPAAQLCEDIGRAVTSDELGALLGRAAEVMSASGVVVWLKGEREELVPVAAHGYGAQALTLILPLPLGAENITTAAWHSGRPQSVPSDRRTRGAVAVPMFQGPQCTGVFTVELADAADTPVARGLAGILAAQFGAAVAPKPPDGVATQPAASLEATGS